MSTNDKMKQTNVIPPIPTICIKRKSDLAKLTYMYEHFAEICGNGTGMLWKRMFEGMWS